MSKKVKLISFSVYGNGLMYNEGAIANAKLAAELYPDWTVQMYCGRKTTCKEELIKLGCEVIEMPYSRIHSGMFWRFLAAWDSKASRAIFRDTDSRLNEREAAAVRAWERSGKICHAMHDHPHHCNLPLSGGMWCINVPFLPAELQLVVRQLGRKPQQRVKDMRFLDQQVYPLVKHSVLHHSSQPLKKWHGVKFPRHSKCEGFVGQQHNERGEPIWPRVR